MDRLAFTAAIRELGVMLAPEQLSQFEAYEEALYAANASMNLTRVPREDCWRRHFLDSLLLCSLIPDGLQVLDLGSGPGLPAWPLACARPDLRVTALDSSGKMLGFLRSQPLANLDVVEARAEEWGVRETFDVVTGRAVAPLPVFLELAAAPCRVGGVLIPMRTPSESATFSAASRLFKELVLEEVVEKALPTTEVVRLFPIYRKVKTTPAKYPRRWSEIRAVQQPQDAG